VSPRAPYTLFDADPASATDDEPPLGERAGRALTRIGARPSREVAYVPGELCAQIDGFSLHARVRVPPGDRDRLEHLCRYVARPAIATERLSLSKHGNVLYRFRRPWRDGTTHVVFEPLVFLERLAALVPRPRTHLVTYHARRRHRWRPLLPPGATASSPARGREDVQQGAAALPPTAATPGPSCSCASSPSMFCAVPTVVGGA